jgi:hypothetical protein
MRLSYHHALSNSMPSLERKTEGLALTDKMTHRSHRKEFQNQAAFIFQHVAFSFPMALPIFFHHKHSMQERNPPC